MCSADDSHEISNFIISGKKKKIRSSSATILTRFLKEVNFVPFRSHVKRRLPTFLNMMTMIWRLTSLYLSLNMGSYIDNKCQFSFLFFFFCFFFFFVLFFQ